MMAKIRDIMAAKLKVQSENVLDAQTAKDLQATGNHDRWENQLNLKTH